MNCALRKSYLNTVGEGVKVTDVVATIVIRGDEVFAAQRGNSEFIDGV